MSLNFMLNYQTLEDATSISQINVGFHKVVKDILIVKILENFKEKRHHICHLL